MILVVEDSKDQQILIRQVFQSAGLNDLVFAERQDQAMDIIERNGSILELILSDVQLEQGNGIDLTIEVRANPQYKEIPIVIITSNEDPRVLPQALDAGANDFLAKPFRPAELIARVRSCLRLFLEIRTRIQREKEILARDKQLSELVIKLDQLSREDPLTGIPNRRHFDMHLDSEWKRATRSDYPLSVVVVDVDHFKQYNDAYGHPAGDDCLRKIAVAIQSSATRPADLTARHGGEEFAMILPETPGEGALVVAERARKAIESMKLPHKGSALGIITASMGIASTGYLEPNASARGVLTLGNPLRLMEIADRALYEAKHSRNKAILAPPVEN